MNRYFESPGSRCARDLAAMLLGVGLGAALMFLLDPESGRRRRALVRDKSLHYARRARDSQEAMLRHASDRAQGVAAAARRRFDPAELVEDGILLERVRAALGHVLDDPRAIDVRVRCGTVILKGPARQEQIEELVACVEHVRGVIEVDNRLSLNRASGPTAAGTAYPDGIAR